MWGGTPWANSQSRVGVYVGGYTMGRQSEQVGVDVGGYTMATHVHILKAKFEHLSLGGVNPPLLFTPSSAEIPCFDVWGETQHCGWLGNSHTLESQTVHTQNVNFAANHSAAYFTPCIRSSNGILPNGSVSDSVDHLPSEKSVSAEL